MHVVHRHTCSQTIMPIKKSHLKRYNSFKHTLKHVKLFVGSAVDYEETTSEFSLTQFTFLTNIFVCMFCGCYNSGFFSGIH